MSVDEPRRDPMEARVITVSREALRLDLAQMRGDINSAMADMELRLTRSLAEMMARKADLVMHQELEARVRLIERDAVFRTGPLWDDLSENVKMHDRLVPEFRQVQDQVKSNTSRIKSDVELKDMMRDERGQASGANWNTTTKIIMLITTIVAILGLYLAWSRARPQAPAQLKEAPVAQIYRIG